ncbi:toll-like receptor 13 [Patella vulgata]|uniref:toll-like receptor 13 n=1 Tax=Patella vulgata TaxID=6465 RepID=UPI00217FD1A4|nr:toll-like receptor 13 [Patella vulgata]
MLASFVVTMIIATSVFGKDACDSGLCTCAGKRALCRGLNLTYIPKFPEKIRNVVFSYNNLRKLDENTFSNLSTLNLYKLSIAYNHIQNYGNITLDNLHQLKIFSLTGNLLKSISLPNVVKSISRIKLSTLVLKYIGVTNIPEDLFSVYESFKRPSLEQLDLSWNNINLFNVSIFKPLKRLKILYLTGNKLADMSSIIMDHGLDLKKLYLNSNYLNFFPNFCPNGTAYFRNLAFLKLENNSIRFIFPEHMNCLKKLNHLGLSSNSITTIEPDTFYFLSSLLYLTLDRQSDTKSYFNPRGRAFNNTKLTKLNLYGNKLKSNHLDPQAFDGANSLKLLTLSNNVLTNTENLNKALSSLKSLHVLLIQNNYLYSLPNVLRDGLPSLTTLDLKYNFISSWPARFFHNKKDMFDINLQYNILKTVTPEMFPKSLRGRLTTIRLNGNPFVCNCELVWFIQWIHRESHKFVGYPDDYRCLNITERICLNNTGVFISVTTVTCFFIFVIFIMSVIYKYIWHIKYHIYMWRYRPRQLLDIAEKHFVYDIFVAYCIQDSDWVLDDLVSTIEDGENIKLCIHERDFLGGKLIIDNIVQHMESSRKVLVVLSNDFARSKWCQFEMSLAQKLVIDMSIESIVVVLLEDIATVNMSKSLDALLKTTTYITWNDQEEGGLEFWERLKTSVKREIE